MIAPKTPKPCAADGCATPRRSANADWCEMHYARLRRTGSLALLPRAQSPLLATRDARMRGLYEAGMSTTEVGAEVGLDPSQVSRKLRRLGVPMRPQRAPRSSEISYGGAHMRVREDRGPASAHQCRCGAPAAQWAYRHDDPDQRASKLGPYSVDPVHYDALCVPCHKRDDLARISGAAS